jgi:hypothetical protein
MQWWFRDNFAAIFSLSLGLFYYFGISDATRTGYATEN